MIALRADFYGRCAEYPALSRLLASNHVLVGPMQPEELRRAITCPAQRVGLSVEDELVQAIVDDVEDAPGALPLVSTALLELWQHRDGRRLRLSRLRADGRSARSGRAARRGRVRAPRRERAAARAPRAPPARRGRRRRSGRAPPDPADRRRRRCRALARRARRPPAGDDQRGHRRARSRGAAARMAAPAGLDRGRPRGPQDRAQPEGRRPASGTGWARTRARCTAEPGSPRRSDWSLTAPANCRTSSATSSRPASSVIAVTARARRRGLALAFGGLALGLIAIAVVAVIAIEQRSDAERRARHDAHPASSRSQAASRRSTPTLRWPCGSPSRPSTPSTTDQAATALREATAAFRQRRRRAGRLHGRLDRGAQPRRQPHRDRRRPTATRSCGTPRRSEPADEWAAGHGTLYAARYSP